MKLISQWFLPLTISLLGLGASIAHDFTVGDIQIEHPWSRPLPAVSTNGAAYMTIYNRGGKDDRLVSVSTQVAQRAALHTHLHEGGLMKMRPVPSVEIPAGGSATFKPGGLHMMLVGLKRPMTEGLKFPLTLLFERAGQVEVTVTVMVPAETTK